VGVTLAQHAVDDTTNASTAVETLLQQLGLESRVVTMAAFLTQRHIAQTIGEKGGDAVMIDTENPPPLRADCARVLTLSPVGNRQATARTVDLGHGRIEQRHIMTSEALVGDNDGSGLAQVFVLGRHVMFQKMGEARVDVVYGVTSRRPERATPERLLALVRGQWQIAHKSHGVRDVTFDEERSQGRCGNIPQGIATIRNTAIGLLRCAGYPNIATACRRLAPQPLQALALIGIELEN
jgi:predicted transposase YbfD/YdcC